MNTSNLQRSLELIQTFLIFMFFLFLGFVIAVIIYALIRATMRDKRAAQAKEQDRRKKFRPDGTAYPPFSRGLCDSCSSVFDKVYFLPSGTRLCPGCYRAFEEAETT